MTNSVVVERRVGRRLAPNEGTSSIYLVRLLAFLLIFGGIVYKGTRPPP